MEHIIRPKAVVLSDSALIPDDNLIVPPPNQFTHEVKRAQPYYYAGAQQGSPPDGEFAEGTNVVLLVYDGGQYCRVADGQGIYAEIKHDSLRRL